MIETSALEPEILANLQRRLQRGLATWGSPEPQTLEKWASDNFYLSAESSYVEQRWHAWTFQKAIMHCMGNDDIVEVDFKKSARVGYTKMMLAAICYFAQHKRRNQAIWQPTDEDRDEFVKTEIDTVLRDVPVMRDVLPTYLQRHKDNTLQAKKFNGSILHTKGGKAAKNYRRISIDVAHLDEIDAFDDDIEKEGDPVTLALKRIEGATFPKAIIGSTPKEKATSKIDARYALADERLKYNIPCPHCGEYHPLTWGGKGETHGFKFDVKDAESPVHHVCPHCGIHATQAEYLQVESRGLWINEDGNIHLHSNGQFTDSSGNPIETPRHIAFHIWTAYSPSVSWEKIVSEFRAAIESKERGDESKLKAWTNTTLGECWIGDVEESDVDEIKQRAEPYPQKYMPIDCFLLLCACDVQGNRIEAQVWGEGRGGQMWDVDHRVFFGNPEQVDVWQELEEFLFGETYQHASGTTNNIYATAIDSGGHSTNAVYAFANKHKSRRVYAIKGSSGIERSIDNGNTKVSYDWQGKRDRLGTILWHVGTHLAKDRFAARLEIGRPGPGYVHLNKSNTDEWFEQLAAEDRVTTRTQYGDRMRWVPHRKRNEIIDMTAYCIWLEERLGLWAKSKNKWWDELEQRVQPPIFDLFSDPVPTKNAESAEVPSPPESKELVQKVTPKKPVKNLFAPISMG